MFATQLISSSVAMPASRTEAGFHSLPPEMVQEILGYLGTSDLMAFANSQVLPGALTPPVFNRMARDFIARCEQAWPNQPWPLRAIACCYAWVREHFEGTDEEFARSYPDTVQLVRILRVCARLDQLSPVELDSRSSCRDLPIANPIIHGPITIPSADEPAFLMVERQGAMSFVTPDGTISRPTALSNCYLTIGGDIFPCVNSMSSRGDEWMIVAREHPERTALELYHPATNVFHRLPDELQEADLHAVSESGKFVAAAWWNLEREGESTTSLVVYRQGDRGTLIEKMTDETLVGDVCSISVDSRGAAVVNTYLIEGLMSDEEGAPPGSQHIPYLGYEVQPGGNSGPQVRLLVDDGDDLVTPGYILAPGGDSIIQNGPESGDLTLRSRQHGGALILRPSEPTCEPQSICMGPAGALGVVTYAGSPDEGPMGQFVGVFDLTSVNANREEAILPKAWFALPDAQHRDKYRNVHSAAWLTRDASRLTVAYVGRTREAKLLTVNLSPE